MSVPERSAPRRPALPPRTAYYLRHLLHGRFRLVPAPAVQPPPVRGRLLDFTREALGVVPESPAFHAQLAALPPARRRLQGWLWLAEAHRPILILDTLGAWTLRLPAWGRGFQALRELRTPPDLAPTRTEAVAAPGGRPQRRHVIPLRYHRSAALLIAVTPYPSGAVAYEAWVWDAVRRQVIPLLWEEAERVIGLFRDLTASWFLVAPPPRPREGEAPQDAPRAEPARPAGEPAGEPPPAADSPASTGAP